MKHASVIARFKIEARAAGRIDSQHIAQVLDVGEDEERNVPFLVMELLHGEDLTQTQERLGVLPPDLVARIAAQACVGLSRAHAAGIIHRDIKPGNLFLSEHDDDERIVKILDFGIAKVKSDTEQGPGMALTRTGNLVGTPLYMPPEQARGDKVIDARADIWSLGVVMYQALTGATPHASADSLGKLIIQICSAPAQPIEEIAPWVPPELAAIVMKCIEIDAPERFQSADDMQKALRAILPGGSAITAEMIKGLSPEERASRPVARSAVAGASRSGSAILSTAPRPMSAHPPAFAEPSAAVTSTTVMNPNDVPKSPSSMFSRGSMPPPGAAVLQPAPLPAGMMPRSIRRRAARWSGRERAARRASPRSAVEQPRARHHHRRRHRRARRLHRVSPRVPIHRGSGAPRAVRARAEEVPVSIRSVHRRSASRGASK